MCPLRVGLPDNNCLHSEGPALIYCDAWTTHGSVDGAMFQSVKSRGAQPAMWVIKSSAMSDPCTHAVWCVSHPRHRQIYHYVGKIEKQCAHCAWQLFPYALDRMPGLCSFYFYHYSAAADDPHQPEGDAICDNDIHSTISFTQTSFYCKANCPLL